MHVNAYALLADMYIIPRRSPAKYSGRGEILFRLHGNS